MNQTFKIGAISLMEDEQGSHVAVDIEGGIDVLASFKYPFDALKYFTEYVEIMAEVAAQQPTTQIITQIPDNKEEHNGDA